MFRSIYERGGRPTTPYSEIAATIQKLKDKGRQSDETDKFLQRVLINSEVTTKRDALLDANAVVVVAGHLRAHDCASTQQYAAGILLNLSQYDRGRLAMASCGSWDCVSYRHACPLFYLLQLALTSANVIVKRVCTAAVLNCSFHAACQGHIEDIGGVNLLLKLLHVNDEDVCVFAAATCWNLTKSPSFVLKLETIHSIPQDNFARTLSQLLWTRCSHYGLTITTNAAMSADQAGVLESGGSNLHLVFACAINSKLAVALRVEQYNVTANQAQVEAQSSKYKSQQKFDENGKRVAVTCSTCAKSIKEKDKAKCLSCASDGCVEIYHVRCSRWAKIVDVNVRDHAFYCDGCLPGVPLQYLDFVATEMSNRSVLTKLDFDILNVARPDKVDVCMLRAPTTNALVGIGDMKYVCHGAKDGTAIVQVKFFLRQCSSMCYNTTSNNVVATTTVAMPPFSFPFLKSTVPPTTLSLHALTLWPTAQLVPVNDSMYLAKTIADLEQASLYEFDGRDERFAIGSNDGTEIWSALQPSRAKCMKMITEATATARPARKHRREKKPHVERKLEK
ncbi:hypothetical protein H310_05012 [Aphanomyces invadans]|uniref:Zinc finger PHD-type domain-containing protein n=1 Tax=Aphanomyces invadans TaxID=157072 RepID=A0A024UDA0_9STRA|nr:hypothetical protein H310_05012 [Aphanomyces invadans]ETW03608.1 hypothetical protein H310_05012 [Aphanomyces invadans]|eukprot:XP_008867837.1 hypothetical protein H310_05012 [Aphanomyces invadans]